MLISLTPSTDLAIAALTCVLIPEYWNFYTSFNRLRDKKTPTNWVKSRRAARPLEAFYTVTNASQYLVIIIETSDFPFFMKRGISLYKDPLLAPVARVALPFFLSHLFAAHDSASALSDRIFARLSMQEKTAVGKARIELVKRLKFRARKLQDMPESDLLALWTANAAEPTRLPGKTLGCCCWGV